MKGAPARVSGDREAAQFPRAVPCFGHAFGEALVCSCGASWWSHQRSPVKCSVNAWGRNRGMLRTEGSKADAAPED